MLSIISSDGLVSFLRTESAGIILRLLHIYFNPHYVGPSGIILSVPLTCFVFIGIVTAFAKLRNLWAVNLLLTLGLYVILFFIFAPHQQYREAYLIPIFMILGGLGIEKAGALGAQLSSKLGMNGHWVYPSLLSMAIIWVAISEARITSALDSARAEQQSMMKESHCWRLSEQVEKLPETKDYLIFVPTRSYCSAVTKVMLPVGGAVLEYNSLSGVREYLEGSQTSRFVILVVGANQSHCQNHGLCSEVKTGQHAESIFKGLTAQALHQTETEESFLLVSP